MVFDKELLDNIYMGDIAKNALVSYLRSHSISVIDYDEIRTDNFMEHDPGWDFKIGKKMITVEVKSSIPPNNEPKSNLIKYRDIKITASHDKGKTWIKPEDIDSNIHIQIYFYTKPYRNGYDSFDTLARDISTNYHLIDKIINASKYNEPLFAGWTTKKNIIGYLNTLPEGQRTSLLVVSESGYLSKQDVRYAETLGVDALLIGEALMKGLLF